jgi:hypothetical protein
MYPSVYAKSQPDKITMIHPTSEVTVSYQQLNERSSQFAQPQASARAIPPLN